MGLEAHCSTSLTISDHLLGWKSKSKLNVRVWTIIFALNLVGKTLWHWTRMSALNSPCNTSQNLLIHTNTYKYILDTYYNTYYDIGLKVQINTYFVQMSIQKTIHANTFPRGDNLCAKPKFDTFHYIPNTRQYIPIHTTIHTRYIPIQDQLSHRFSSWGYVLTCIVVCIGMY